MVYYISSNVYNQTISNTLKENEEIVLNQQIGNHIQFQKFIKSNLSKMANIDYFLVDISALDDTDEEIIEAIKMFRTMYEDTRIIIIAPTRLPGDELLAQIFALGIRNIIATMDYLILKNELQICLSEKGKSFKDALEFKDIKKTEDVLNRAEIKEVSKVMIGVAGVQSRIGSTHNAIILAGFLRKQGFLVALAECNSSESFHAIRENFGQKFHNHMYFTMNGIDYYPNVTEQSLGSIMDKSYNFIIMDFGNYQNSIAAALYHKCHVRIMISGSKAWELNGVVNFLNQYDDDVLSHIHFLFNFTDSEYEKPLRKEMKSSNGESLSVFFLPYFSDPFNTYDFPAAKTFLKDYLPCKEVKKKGLFSKIRKGKS